jgi:hypothetical protein
MAYEIGDKVFIPASANIYWTGTGTVDQVFEADENFGEAVSVKMLTGAAKGRQGAFTLDEVQRSTVTDSVMEILKVTRPKNDDTSLKVYGEVKGESGKVYKFAYFRRPNFRGWICSCESFLLSKFAKKLNCKHLHFVRQQVGRYGASVAR